LTACGADQPGDGVAATTEGRASTSSTSWPGFGGPSGDFRVEAGGLGDGWPGEGPVERWSHPLGAGYSTISVHEDVLYVTSRDGDRDVVQARRA
ncbi:MAG: hypothetical protein GTO30_15775, partial [Acidobacteria bacterium]|nr:hypothetical protein [Acidobacteriota bacterium]NIQ85647.1 hypothetical protein [Acidobacteriota bacterium]